MKAIGVTRKTDIMGRFALPASLRRELDININDSMEIYTEDQVIMIKKYVPACIFCDSSDSLVLYRDKHICPTCLSDLAEE